MLGVSRLSLPRIILAGFFVPDAWPISPQGTMQMNLLTRNEVCARARICLSTLSTLIDAGKGPRVCRIGRRILFKPSDVETWIDGLSS
jgi:predicted DNA-binding transcriptional regulator AlpA